MTTDVNTSSDTKSSIRDFFSKDYDKVKEPKNVESNNKWSHEAGMARLRKMYSTDEYGRESKEMLFVTQTVSVSCMGGGIIGAIVQSRETFLNFMENNQATKFANHMDAKRKLQRQMCLAVMKGGFHWGWRVGLFSASFTTVMTTISVYRGYESVMEYAIAGGLTGGLYKIGLGLKGCVAGATLGTILGCISGGLSMLALKLGGNSLDDLRNFSQMVSDHRQSTFTKNRQEQMLKEYTDLSGRPAKGGLDELNLDDEPKLNEITE